MAKPLIDLQKQIIDGVTYINGVRCDDTVTELIELPCGCGETPPGTEPPQPPTVPDEQTCNIANNLAMLAYNATKYLFDQSALQPDNWLGNLVISSNFRTTFTETTTSQNAVHSYMLTSRAELLDMGYDLGASVLGQIQGVFVCAAYKALQFSTGQVLQVWKDRFVEILRLEIDSVMGTAEAWEAVADFCLIIPLAGWEYYSTVLSSTTLDPEDIGITSIINLSCGECNPFGGIECEDAQIGAYFFDTGDDGGFQTYGGLCSDLPASIFQNLPFANVIQTIRTDRAFEVPTNCQGGNTAACRSAGVVRIFSSPITLCSMQALAKIYTVAPPGTTTHTGNSSRLAIFCKTVANPSWQLLDAKVFGIEYGLARSSRWAGIGIENVTQVLAVHMSGGSYAAIDRVIINLPADVS